MTVKDKIKRTSRVLMKSTGDKFLFDTNDSKEAVNKQEANKSGEFEDAKTSVDKKAELNVADEGSIVKDANDKAEKVVNATDKAEKIVDATDKTENIVDTNDKTEKIADAKDTGKEKVGSAIEEITKKAEKVAEIVEEKMKRRRSLFKRNPTSKKEGGPEDGFSKELKKLQRVLSKVRRQPGTKKEVGTEEIAESTKDAAAKTTNSVKEEAENLVSQASEDLSVEESKVLGAIPTIVAAEAK